VYLVFMNLFVFTRQPPTSRHSIGDRSIIVGGGIKGKHWAQGYHCGRGKSRNVSPQRW